ncbi:MAG: hypothetical protein DRJ56_07075 [Thermoprotei archaeon]|nr:MAG: hypothetical protein DRJ56_07075 [Thermoprotei archaeon]
MGIRAYMRKSPDGYYVLVVSEGELRAIEGLLGGRAVIEEAGGGKFMVKVRSRGLYVKVLRALGVRRWS